MSVLRATMSLATEAVAPSARQLILPSPAELVFGVVVLLFLVGGIVGITLLVVRSRQRPRFPDSPPESLTERIAHLQQREHILAGYLAAAAALPEVVALVRASASSEAAQRALREGFDVTEIQARAVVDMPLRRFATIETAQITDEHASIHEQMAELERRIADGEA